MEYWIKKKILFGTLGGTSDIRITFCIFRQFALTLNTMMLYIDRKHKRIGEHTLYYIFVISG